MRNYVIINGVNSNTINGLAINELPPITKPPMRVLQEEIDGRDGDITTNLGYGAYDKVMTIGLFHTFDINQIIAFFNGTGTIVFSNEPDKKYNYKIIEQIDYEKLINFKTATVTFHCQPFKYPLEETPLIIEPTIDTLENVTSASIETNESTLSTTLKGNTSQYTTTGANVLESIATSNTTNIYEDVLWAEGLQANTTYTFQFVGVVGNRISGNSSLFTTDTYHNITSGINTMTLTTKSDISTSTGSQYTSGKGWRIFKNAKSGNVANVFTDVMANVGSTALPYEPYTGGIPAPNPSYPQPINVVTGDNTIEVVGKNLWDFDNNNFQNQNAFPSVRNSDGSITFTCSNSGYCFAKHTITLEAGTYTLSTSSNSNFTIIIDGTEYSKTFTISEKKNVDVRCFKSNATIGDTLTITWIQLEKGNQATTYAPYQSQTYPIYLGVENLFDYANTTFINNSTGTTSKGDEYVTITPNTSSNYSGCYVDNNSLPTDTTTSLSFKAKADSARTINVSYFDKSNSFSLTTSWQTFRIDNATHNSNTLDFYSGTDHSGTKFYIKDIQLVKGSKSSSYTPYGTTPIELCKIGDYQDKLLKSTGKNLFSGYTKGIKLDSVNGSQYNDNSGATSDYIPLSIVGDNSFIISGMLNTLRNFVCAYNSNKEFLGRTSATNPTSRTLNKDSFTAGTPQATGDVAYIRVTFYEFTGLSGVIDDLDNANIQLEKGTQATSYEPYGIVWYLHKEIGKVVLDGSEDENYIKSAYSDTNYCTFTNFDYTSLIGNVNNAILLSNYFVNNNIGSAIPNKTGISYIDQNYGLRIAIEYSNASDVAPFKTWLSTHNTNVYFVLATPTYTKITNETLISQLEALKGVTTYYGITNINQQNNDLPFIMDLSYMEKDTDKVIVDNIGNIYSKPTIALEGNGTGGIYLNGNQILSVELTDKMTISISDMEAFNPDTHALLNRDVTGNYNSMTLQPNENTIKVTGGITKATITNYTRYL